MRKINFTKMVASGNDFVVIPLSRYPVIPLKGLAKKICDRRFGIGADGMLLLERSKKADIRMRIFNPDGSEAAMCGNGSRCTALYIGKGIVNIETKAGLIAAGVSGNNVRIKLIGPKEMQLGLAIKVNQRLLKVNFINTGVPHTVIFVEGLDKIDVHNLGRLIRYHRAFAPRGTNVNFVEVLNDNSIKLRTYERGVEEETLACGTGATAAALITAYALGASTQKIKVQTKGSEILKVYFERKEDKFKNVWLEGQAKIVYKGEYYV